VSRSTATVSSESIPSSCADIFFQVLPNNDLKGLTSARLLLTFSGGYHVSFVILKIMKF
jgi:hypothetical protein